MKKSVIFNKILKSFVFCFALSALFTTVSCEKRNVVPSLEETEAFSLKYGNFEDEINVFSMSKIGDVNTYIAMRDGFFYIANGESQKVMEMNSYGDLLTIIFNEETNRKPSFYNEEEASVTTRNAVIYPFNEISGVAVDSRKYLYVVDKMPLERQELDEENNQVLSHVILRFDSNGTYCGFVGQQGLGGTPFPYIKRIFTTANNELVVLCSVNASNVIFWFSEESTLMYSVTLSQKNIPDHSEKDSGSWNEIQSIIPDTQGHRLFVNVNEFSNYIDEASRVQSGINYEKTEIYVFDVEQRVFTDTFQIPSYVEQVAAEFNVETYNIPYDFIGVSDNGWLFFLVSTEEGFSVLMYEQNGTKILRRNLELDHQKSLFYTFDLNDSGILSMLNVTEEKALVEWWRTDTLIQSVVNR